MPITALPSLVPTSPTFKADVDSYFGIKIPQFSAEAEAARVEVNLKEGNAATSAGLALTRANAAAQSVTDAANQVTLAVNQVTLATDQVTLATAQKVLAANSASSAVNAPGTSGTSTTSLTIGAATQTFTTQTAKAWVVGQSVSIARTSAPAASIMYGTITAYDAGTGAMSVLVGVGNFSGSGTFTDWTIALSGARGASGASTIIRSARTANTILAFSDQGTLIDITSGTFTQTFAAAVTLGSSWFCYIRNAGTGGITLDPDLVETIDGLTSYIMYPGEVRLVQCDGTALRTVILQGGTFTSRVSGNWTKPPGYQTFDIRVTGGGTSGGGGGGGGTGGTNNYGGAGGGGGYGGQCGVTVRKRASAASLPSTVAYLIGAATTGGAGGAGGAGAVASGLGNVGIQGGLGLVGNASSLGAVGAALRIDAPGGAAPSGQRGVAGVAGNGAIPYGGASAGINAVTLIALVITATDQIKLPTANGGDGLAGVQQTTLTLSGTAGGNGGAGSTGFNLVTAELGSVGGAASATSPTAGVSAANAVTVSTVAGLGGAGGGGGGGSAGSTLAANVTGVGGNGGNGANGAAGEVEIIGVV